MRRATFLGGEPTIQRSFLPALSAAVELGFDDIVIFTNLVRGREPRFLEAVNSLGRFTWRISIQGGDEATHDRVVGRPGAFAKIVTGLRWLVERGHDVTANACIQGESHSSLPGYAAIVREFGLRQLHLDTLRPGSAGVRTEAELRRMVVPYAQMAPSFSALLDAVDAWDPELDVHVGNLPYCVLPQHAHRIAHGGEATLTVTTDDQGELGRVWDKYAHQGSDKVFGPRCGACAFRAECRGVPREYVEFHGTDELVPVTRAQIEELDPRVARWLDTGWRPGRAEGGARPEPDPRVLRLALAVRDRGPYAGWSAGKARVERGGDAVVVPIRRGDESLLVRIDSGGLGKAARLRILPGIGTDAEAVRTPGEAVLRAIQPRKSGPPASVNPKLAADAPEKRLELFIASGCNLQCSFCCESERIARKSFMPWSEIESKLQAAARDGIHVVQFMGGEATLHPQFAEALQAAKALSLTTYTITNLMRWQQPEFAQSVAPWLDEVMVSMHALGDEAGELVTGRAGWWRGFSEAVVQARSTLRARVRASTVLTRHNVDDLEAIADVLLTLRPHAWVMGSAVPVPGARVDPLDSNLSLTELRALRPRFAALHARCAAAGCQLVFFAMPHCALGPNLWDATHDGFVDDQDLADGAPSTVQAVTFWSRADDLERRKHITLGRTRTARCAGCAREQLCGGHFSAYFARHGDGELEPVRA